MSKRKSKDSRKKKRDLLKRATKQPARHRGMDVEIEFARRGKHERGGPMEGQQ